MRGILRERLYNKHYSKLLSTRSDKSTSSVNTFSSVTILAPARFIKEDDLKKTKSFFDKMEVRLHLYLLREKGDPIAEIDRVNIIERDDCEWYGVPSQEILIQWLANKTDLLILSDPNHLPLMRYLCAASNSKLKSGLSSDKIKRDDYDIDLWIDPSSSGSTSLFGQCKQTYGTLSKLGIGPPVIG